MYGGDRAYPLHSALMKVAAGDSSNEVIKYLKVIVDLFQDFQRHECKLVLWSLDQINEQTIIK